jgi:C4-dicarboxylate transporter
MSDIDGIIRRWYLLFILLPIITLIIGLIYKHRNEYIVMLFLCLLIYVLIEYYHNRNWRLPKKPNTIENYYQKALAADKN